MIRHFAMIVVVAILMTSCIKEPPAPTFDPAAPCDVILNPALLSVPFNDFVLGGPETASWISTVFPTSTVKYSTGTENGGVVEEFYWSEGDYSFSLILSQERRYIRITHLASQGPTLEPSLGHILRCFGDPEYYSVWADVPMGETMGTYFSLWYPKLGVSFMDLTRGAAGPYPYTASSPMGIHTWIFPVGSVEEMLRNQYGIEELVEPQLSSLKEWPENFTEIRVE